MEKVWNGWYERAKDNGIDNKEVIAWIKRQKIAFNNGKLSESRRAMLKEIGIELDKRAK